MANLRTERDGEVLRITLARPDRRNAFDADLIRARRGVRRRRQARAVVLAGDGPSFCAGADVEWMRSSVELSYDDNVTDALALRRMLEAIDGCPAPVVCRVQGHALGGGAGLVACADVAIAAPDAVFAFSEAKLGIVPAVISPFALAKIGPSWARRLFPTGERFGAELALRIGLVHEVADDLDAAVERVARRAALRGPARGASREAPRPRRAARRARDRAADRRAPDERRGSGRAQSVPGAAPAGLVGLIRAFR